MKVSFMIFKDRFVYDFQGRGHAMQPVHLSNLFVFSTTFDIKDIAIFSPPSLLLNPNYDNNLINLNQFH